MDLKFFMLDPDTFRVDFARSKPKYKNPRLFLKGFLRVKWGFYKILGFLDDNV